HLVSEGTALTDEARDYTVHVDVGGLSANTTYYYQFRALGLTSVRGRTKTLPGGSSERMRFGVVSCANYPAGFFNVYGLLAQADVDLILHLGDYLYEYENLRFGDGSAIGRLPDPPKEIVSLEDYRRRHAQYKTDPDLRELHRQHPFIAIWDDHEVANDAYRSGAQNHQPAEGDFAARKQSALRAYREWMPIRVAEPQPRIFRSFACGDLLDLVMLDTRHAGRDPQLDRCDIEGLAGSERQLLGLEQEAWLGERLSESQARGARWRLVGQQVMFAPLLRSASGCVQNPDQWDGYAASRARVLSLLRAREIDNVVLLTGDIHSAWAIDVAEDPFDPARYDAATGRGSELVEFVTPAVSSPASGQPGQRILDLHPHVKFTDQTRQGYVLLDVTRERVQGEWYFVPSVREQSAEVELGAVFQTLAGQPHLVEGAVPSSGRASIPRPAS
ncbi:MAG TPA: alkaline phosphatase D family protein, partial [Polyangiaceae bacterium]|nr:alkaline phosphatase D family protein [Polyangiaceae bacterium]